MNKPTNSEVYRKPKTIPAIAKYLISGAILIFGFGAMAGLASLKKPPENRQDKVRIPRVNTFAAVSYNGDLTLEVNGEVKPHKRIRISTEIFGKIKSKSPKCQPGQPVKANEDVLIEIESSDYKDDWDQAKADFQQAIRSYTEIDKEIEGAQKSFDTSVKDYQLQVDELNRKKRLGGALSASELNAAKRAVLNVEQAKDRAESTLNALKERKESFKYAKESAEKRVEKAKRKYDRCKIKSNIDGIVFSDLVEVGEVVQAGTQLLVVEDTSTYEVKCSLRPDQIQWLWDNSSNPLARPELDLYSLPKATVKISPNYGADTDLTWTGELRGFDGGGLDEKTKTVPCRIVVDDPVAISADKSEKRILRDGMYVRIKIILEKSVMTASKQKYVQFPAIAVQPGGFVWTAVDGKLDRHQVQVVDRVVTDGDSQFTNYVVIRDDKDQISVGSQVILSPLAQPEIGKSVIVNNPTGEKKSNPDKGSKGKKDKSSPSKSTKNNQPDSESKTKKTAKREFANTKS